MSEWRIWGSIPDAPTEDDEFGLGQDLMQAQSRDGATIVDVGWYPDFDPKGEFLCRLIRDNDWLHPVEEYRTRDAKQARAWFLFQVDPVAKIVP